MRTCFPHIHDRRRPGRRPESGGPPPPLAGLISWAGCRDDMYAQPRYEAYEPSASSRTGPRRGRSPRRDRRPWASSGPARSTTRGKIDGCNEADVLPFPIHRGGHPDRPGSVHGLLEDLPATAGAGNGKGMVVRLGSSPPPDLHSDYLKKAPVGHFFNVITHGHERYVLVRGPDSREAPLGHRRLLRLSG